MSQLGAMADVSERKDSGQNQALGPGTATC